MRKQTLASFGLSLVVALTAIFAAVAPASAKSDYGIAVKYNVPFDFYVGNKKMAAGKYEVQRISDAVYRISSLENEKGILVAASMSTNDERRIQSAKLVFNRYGQHNFLRRVYLQTSANGRVLNESKTERQIRKEKESDDKLAMKMETIEINAE